VASSGNRPVPFAESVPVTLWIARPCLVVTPSDGTTNHINTTNKSHATDSVQTASPDATPQECQVADVHVIVKVDSKLNVQLNHYQLLFLLRLADTLTEQQAEIAADVLAIMHEPPKKSNAVLAIVLRELEFAMVCPPLPEVQTFASSSREDSSIDDLYAAEHCGKGESDVTLTRMSKGEVDKDEAIQRYFVAIINR